MSPPKVGDRIHGYAGGVFGGDSYTCRTIITVAEDWLVTRNDHGRPEFLDLTDYARITDVLDDRGWCDDECPSHDPGREVDAAPDQRRP